MRLLVQHDFGTLKTVQSVNTDQAAPTFFDDGKRVFGSPFPCNVAASRAECSGDALVHMEQQNVAERSVLNVRHHKLGTAGSLCFLLGDCRETASQMVQHIQPQTEQATSNSGSSSAPRTNAAMATMMPTKMLVPFRMALSDFIVDYRPFTKTKRAASGVNSEHLMQPKVRSLFGGHAGCGLILGSLPFCQWQEISI